MQVSWIDEKDMGALLGSLRGPVPAAATLDDVAHHAGSLFDEPDEALPKSVPAPEPPQATPVVITTEAHPDLDDFRARLQAIRERAMTAGLINRTEETIAPAMEQPEVDADEEPYEIEEPLPVEMVSHLWSDFLPYGNSSGERLGSFVAWARSPRCTCVVRW